jgi:restriction system protein
MSRRRGFVGSLAQIQRASIRSAEANIRALQRAQREQERAARREERELLANEKERLQLFHEGQEDEVISRNQDLEESVEQLGTILNRSLDADHRLNYEKLKSHPALPLFHAGRLGDEEAAPSAEKYRPDPPGFFARLVPGSASRYQLALRSARARFDADVAGHATREASRKSKLQAAEEHHREEIEKLEEKTKQKDDAIDALKSGYESSAKSAVTQYCEAVLSSQAYPEGWPESFKLAYAPESKQVVIEYDFPGFEIVPEVGAYKYLKAKKEIVTVPRADGPRRHLYSQTIAQATLCVIHTLFNAEYAGHVETIVFNGHVHAIDESTGHAVHPCLITLRTTRSTFSSLDLARVDAEVCLKGLNASVSKRPTELAPVRPVLEFRMVDPRFVKEDDILAGLDNRTNLMDLSPRDFESLITNLFTRMGLETRQTRPSRDGGVDCVAYDPRPIFGGKVVIQAKRYKNTVGVSAVRDLFGTMQNEGASKGILVTTSGYGKSSFEFADHKPLELLDGSNLLYLLAEHTGIEAKIEAPDDWQDPSPLLVE